MDLKLYYICSMALIHINIERVVVKDDPEIKRLLKEILCKLDTGNDEPLKQEIMDKLNKAIADIKSTI